MRQSQRHEQYLRALQAENQQSITLIEHEQKTLDKLQTQVQTLEAQPVAAQNQLQHLVQANRAEAGEVEALRRLLAEKEGEADRLRAQLETTKPRPEAEMPGIHTATRANKLPVLLELIHNRAVPFNKEFYHSKLKLIGPAVVERRSEGETIAEIHKPGSAFNAMLGKLNPEKQYVSCLLNSDSFEIFREVRRIAQAKGIDLGWEPADTTPEGSPCIRSTSLRKWRSTLRATCRGCRRSSAKSG